MPKQPTPQQLAQDVKATADQIRSQVFWRGDAPTPASARAAAIREQLKALATELEQLGH